MSTSGFSFLSSNQHSRHLSTIQYYFSLQLRMLNRHLREGGVHPGLGYVLVAATFTGLSYFLFIKTSLAIYVYSFFAISSLSSLSEKKRNQFLIIGFSKTDYRKIRLLENYLFIFPFLLFLLYRAEWEISLALFGLASGIAFITINFNQHRTIPTPFSKHPFEFPVGFRKNWLLFIIAYLLLFISIGVDNYNLGIFSILLVFAVCATFYTHPEMEYYIWIYAETPKKFLFKKIKIALKYTATIVLPMAMVLSIFNSELLIYTFGLIVFGLFMVVLFLLAKYSVYPRYMNIPESIIIIFSLMLPPIMVFSLNHFYKKSIRKLSSLL